MSLPVIILGAGGHAKVLIEALLAANAVIKGVVDADPAMIGASILGAAVIGGDEVVKKHTPESILLVNGLGTITISDNRRQLYEKFKNAGYTFATVLHPSAVVASDVTLGEGAQVMAGAVIQPGCRIGVNSIVNTRASVDHDCMVGDHVHIAPGVTLSGGVTIGRESHIGTGATVIQGVCIGERSLIGAGSLVLTDVAPRVTVMGVPARVVKR